MQAFCHTMYMANCCVSKSQLSAMPVAKKFDGSDIKDPKFAGKYISQVGGSNPLPAYKGKNLSNGAS